MSEPAIRAALEHYLEDGTLAELEAACRLAAQGRVDIAALLEWLEHAPAEPLHRDRALRALRAALRLPAMPGPVCRPHRL